MKAVIMTGGEGTRMNPLTSVTPKGLLPIDGTPILEIIVRQLRHFGFPSVTMACGYMANYIQHYFRDGTDFGVAIQYHVESEPLGTAGALQYVKDLREAFLVVNCDVLTDLNFRAFADFHGNGDAPLTIASQQRNVPIDFGVLETVMDRVVQFHEKPRHSACVNMGIYMMDPAVLTYIPRDTPFDVPSLVRALLTAGQTVRHYENNAYWLDMGTHRDYQLADEVFSCRRDQFLPGDRV